MKVPFSRRLQVDDRARGSNWRGMLILSRSCDRWSDRSQRGVFERAGRIGGQTDFLAELLVPLAQVDVEEFVAR